MRIPEFVMNAMYHQVRGDLPSPLPRSPPPLRGQSLHLNPENRGKLREKLRNGGEEIHDFPSPAWDVSEKQSICSQEEIWVGTAVIFDMMHKKQGTTGHPSVSCLQVKKPQTKQTVQGRNT